jgi:diguanylate cyclase (GGDEF)-like protein/PAS domain S-box-containing protein
MQRLSRHLLEQIVALDEDAVVVTDANLGDHPLIYVNAAFEGLTGYGRDEVLGQNCRLLQGEATEAADLAAIRGALSHSKTCAVRVTNYRKDGSSFVNELRLTPLRATHGGVRYYVGRMRAVAASSETGSNGKRSLPERADSQIQGLSDRGKFFDFASRDLSIARRQKTPFTILVFRIRHLDRYRATFGAQAVESCLRMVGGRIGGGLRRAGDLCARLDDDIFAALVTGQPENDAMQFAEGIADQVRRMALHNPRAPEKFITVATGVASGTPGPNDTIESLIASAAKAAL